MVELGPQAVRNRSASLVRRLAQEKDAGAAIEDRTDEDFIGGDLSRQA